jgi:hypothetical protein
VEEAYEETTKLKTKLGATQDSEDGTIVLGFKDKPDTPAQAPR